MQLATNEPESTRMPKPVTRPSPKPGSRTPPKRRRSSGIIVPYAAPWYKRLVAWLIYLLVRTVSASLRYRVEDRSGYFAGGPPGPTIFCIWHNRLALSMTMYYGFIRKSNATKGLAAMVSASKDGAFLAAILKCFGVQPVRGSSSRRGAQALLELTTWAEQGYDLALTPDGPRGPCYQVQEGVTSLAQVTGLSILPVTFNIRWRIRARSWDRFVIPLPLARCEIVFGAPIRVPREASDEEREHLRQQLEGTLREISRE